nr:hypothetical protein [Tanacetum cinerariifolium]GFA27166.1 hypothetical protein [Tanacetum cinerariifolium]
MIPQSSGPYKRVGDEHVYTREDDRVVRAATPATRLEAEQESGIINKTRSTTILNKPSRHGTGSGSGLRCQDTTLGDADAHTRVFALEQSKTDQDLVIKKLKMKVKSLKRKQRARTSGMNLFKIGNIDDDFDDIDDMVDEAIENVEGDTVNASGAVNTATNGVSAASTSVTTAGVSISTAEPRIPPTTTTTSFEDKDLTIAQTLIKIENPRMAQIQLDEELAKRMLEEEMAKFEKGTVNSFVPMDSKVVKDSGKNDDSSSKQAGSKKKRAGSKLKPKSPKKLKVMKEQESAEDEQEKEELRLCLKIVQDEDRAINYKTLAVKS